MPYDEAKLRYRRSPKGIETLRRQNARYYAANKVALNAYGVTRHRERRYGVTQEQYDIQLLKQDKVCAICKGVNDSGRRLAVDHDHSTNEFRGLLCDRCNRGIGFFREDLNLLSKAMVYLCRIRTS